MTELDKLEKYLKDHKIPYERTDKRQLFTSLVPYELPKSTSLAPYQETYSKEWHMISVPNDDSALWDVTGYSSPFTYGTTFLELMGSLVTDEEYEVDWAVKDLTADDVIRRIENSPEKQAL